MGIICQGYNSTVTVQNVTLYNLTISSSSSSTSAISTYSPKGLFRINSKGASTVCQQQFAISNVVVQNFNYNATQAAKNYAGVSNYPTSAVITIDYSGLFQLYVTNTSFTNIFAYQGPGISVTSLNPPSGSKISISSCNFTNLTAVFEGGAVYTSYSGFGFSYVRFDSTKSLRRNGGAIFGEYPF